MNIPVEIIVVAFGSIIALQGWTLVEIVSLKVKMARYQDLERRIANLETHITNLETHRR